MKQIRFDAFGPPSRVARCIEVPDVGPPSAWEVIVEVEAFPINPADLAMLAGRYGTLPKPPSPIGMEAVGRVVDKGASAKDIAVGDRVMIMANYNWSQRRKLPLAAIYKLPAQADILQSAMLKVNPATAYCMLNGPTNLATDEWVIQSAPLSSVGRCVIQIAKEMGLRTINVVRRPEAKEQVLSLGGDVVLEDGPELIRQVKAVLAHSHLRLALDPVGGAMSQRLAECLSDGGQIVNYGMLSGDPCQIHPEQVIFRGIALSGFWLSKVVNRMSQHERTAMFDKLSQWMLKGVMYFEIDQTFPMEDISAAIRRAEQPGRRGKVLVLPNGHVC